MKVEFRDSFAKDLKKIAEKSILKKIAQLIKIVEFAPQLSDIPGIKKLSGSTNYYRVRIGNYRMGIFVLNQTVTFVRALHRKDIYRYFP